MGLSVSGVGSGLDIQNLISQLVQAEAAPREFLLAKRKNAVDIEISALGELKNTASGFASASAALKDSTNFVSYKATSADKTVFTATASEGAVAASYEVEVSALATAVSKKSSNAFSPTLNLQDSGTATLTIELESSSFDISIDAANSTLSDIRDAINNADDNVGVTATVINGVSGSDLVLTANATGNKTLTISESGGTANLTAFVNNIEADAATPGADASIQVDGITATSSTNTFENVIDNVSITAVKANVGETEKLTISTSNSGISAVINDFVKQYNALNTKIKDLTFYNTETRESGALFGDSIVRSLTGSLMRNMFNDISVNTKITNITQLGISMDSSGDLSFDSSKLESELANHADEVISFLTDKGNGFGQRIDTVISSYTSATGIFQSQLDGLDDSLKRIGTETAQLTAYIIGYQERVTKEFTALDTLLGQLSSTSASLESSLKNLPGFVKQSSSNS
ncbi:flagellar hook-associated family protein [Piscirickettsia salmonis]|uniref:Flagellar hook-associated protein 2 n=1 Tax=Piscirickettsia salmonis TaxID=1238 RepID=A0A9Q5YGV0_PISSA|nr:flagellar filament capping protein FliD [Piscirickettsia salmonis]ALA24605.1 flagellar hook-associated family protein FliD [Piscirickettsia salmonis]APS44954.1 flagellar hook-associated family protein [Piscirickettsia salmonis]APS48315.1 flagellar hook-associated family protein [Piscirickettsia salmonis]APS49577.1 flagellar hook-associated family protein [Piscirickettsia salmonis]APS52758.1 flagellar hook-associated family protein [Piscirickettsia salmonis]